MTIRLTHIFLLPLLASLFFACEKAEVRTASDYACTLGFADSSATHPRAQQYQTLLDQFRRNGTIPGAQMAIYDQHGLWTGASGKADIANAIDLEACTPMMIGSISKNFTATVIFTLIDEGRLNLNDPVRYHLSQEIVDKVANTDKATIRHLLAHRSGIPDYYTTQFELDRINKEYNNWRQEDILKYTYGISADFEVDETYGYSNTNYVLLGIIAENASGESLPQLYRSRIFNKAGLTSGWYDKAQPFPDGASLGYADIHGNGNLAETKFMYGDETNQGDGAVIINAGDLLRFARALDASQLVSQNSLNAMQDWFDLPEDWHWDDFGEYKNGNGLEHFQFDQGWAYGHSGGVDGFGSYLFHFPEQDMTFTLIMNTATSKGEVDFVKSILALMAN